MKMEKSNRKISYWQKVSVLFTKAGAFGIVSSLIQPEQKRAEIANVINNNRSLLPRLRKNKQGEPLNNVSKIA